MKGLEAVPGQWADSYWCWKGKEIETIKYMLELHSPDFPVTCCVGFTIIERHDSNVVKIYPKVRSKNIIRDYYTGEVSKVDDND